VERGSLWPCSFTSFTGGGRGGKKGEKKKKKKKRGEKKIQPAAIDRANLGAGI